MTCRAALLSAVMPPSYPRARAPKTWRPAGCQDGAMPLNRDRARLLAAANAVARCALGGTALTMPELPLAPWIGDARRDPSVRLLARALGVRDVALGLGALFALRQDGPARGWVEAGGLADAGDVVVTLAGFTALPRRGRWLVLAAASAGVLTAVVVSRTVDRLEVPASKAPAVDRRR